jgi:hypothetical protein
MKTLYIGDIHGHIEVIRFVYNEFPNHRKIFVGDYVDAFDKTRAEQLACIEMIVDKAGNDPNTIALMGNHELSYLVPAMKCAGYARNFQDMLTWHQITNKMWKYLKYYHYDAENHILVTHAGLCKYIWKERGLTLATLEDTLFQWARDPDYCTPMYWIGRQRGGVDHVGGPLWCDWNADFTPVLGLTQIVGHTAWIDLQHEMNDGIRKRGNNYNLDCYAREFEFLEFDDVTKQFDIIQIDRGRIAL